MLEDSNGPLGQVNDYWWRVEYQRRGAVHVHMVVWCEPHTIPDDAIMAQLPRSDHSNDLFTQGCRSYVERFQLHGACNPERCFKGPGERVLDHCKYGFPFKSEEYDRPDESMRMLYRKRCKEDSRVVPYNLVLLLLMGAHVNIQRVTSGGWEFTFIYLPTTIKPDYGFLKKNTYLKTLPQQMCLMTTYLKSTLTDQMSFK